MKQRKMSMADVKRWLGSIFKPDALNPRPVYARPQILAFIIIVGAIGTYLLWTSFAAVQVVASLEAEKMTLPAGASVGTEAGSSGGQVVKFTKSGTASGTVSLPINTSSLTVKARGSKCRKAWPKMTVAIDGTTVLSTTVNVNYFTPFTSNVPLGSGNHAVTITHLGTMSGKCATALSVDVTQFLGDVPLTPAPTVSLSASPASISAGAASTLTWSSTNATSCTASGSWSGAKATSGSASTGALAATSTYTLDCTGAGGSTSANTTVTVTAVTPSPSPSPTPTVSCTGVTVSPGQLTQTLVNSKPSGTVFCLKNGTHAVTGSILALSNDQFIGESATGTVLDFANATNLATQNGYLYCIYGYGTATGQNNVTISNMTVKNCPGTAIKTGNQWTLDKLDLSYNNIGAQVYSSNITNSNIHHNRQYGLAGGGTNVLVQKNEVAFNNTAHNDPGNDAGGSKFVGGSGGQLNGITWDSNWVHDNYGNGIWSDGNVINATYKNNLVENNYDSGIFHEISWAAVITGNTVRNNMTHYATVGASCFWGGGIMVNDSQDVQIYGNTVEAANGTNGICMSNVARGSVAPFPTALANISIHDNSVKLTATGMSGQVGTAASNVTFDKNTYLVKSATGAAWAYQTYPLTWTQFQSKGQEANGTLTVY